MDQWLILQHWFRIIPYIQIEILKFVAELRTLSIQERQTECFDYNYEFDYKSMDVVWIQLFRLFCGLWAEFLHLLVILIWLV
jgi:hypothetical protein